MDSIKRKIERMRAMLKTPEYEEAAPEQRLNLQRHIETLECIANNERVKPGSGYVEELPSHLKPTSEVVEQQIAYLSTQNGWDTQEAHDLFEGWRIDAAEADAERVNA